MREIFLIFFNNIRRIFSKKYNLYTMLIAPPLLIAVSIYFTSSMEQKVTLGLLIEEKSPQEQSFVQLLKHTDNITVLEAEKETLRSDLINNKYDVVITIPQGFQKNVEALNEGVFAKKPEEALGFTAVRSSELLEKAKQLSTSYLQNNESVDTNNLLDPADNRQRPAQRGIVTRTVGFLLIILFISSVIYSNLLLEDRENKTYTRLQFAPVQIWRYIVGNGLSTFCINYFQVLFTFLIAKYIFQIKLGVPFGDLMILMFITVLTATFFGLFMVAFAKSTYQAFLVANALVVLTSILGGCLWDLNKMPIGLQYFSNILPQKWVLEASLQLEQNQTLYSISSSLLFVTGFAFVFFLLSVSKLRRKQA